MRADLLASRSVVMRVPRIKIRSLMLFVAVIAIDAALLANSSGFLLLAGATGSHAARDMSHPQQPAREAA